MTFLTHVFWYQISLNGNLVESCYDVRMLKVQDEGIPIFYQPKAPSICCVVVEEEVELKAGKKVEVVCGQLECRFDLDNRTPGILEGPQKTIAERLARRFCIARSLTVLKEGKTPVGKFPRVKLWLSFIPLIMLVLQ